MRNIWELSVLYLQLSYESKSIPKSKVYNQTFIYKRNKRRGRGRRREREREKEKRKKKKSSTDKAQLSLHIAR